MITIFVVLGVVLLSVPAVCAIFVLFSKLKQQKRAEYVKNATRTTTTVRKGDNGRTIFQTTAVKSSPPRSRQRDPILPFTTQQASKLSQTKSVKHAWQRLSRPFSAMPATFENDDQIELTQSQRSHTPYSKSQKPTSILHNQPISPVTPRYQRRMTSSSTWTTINGLDDSPISPLSVMQMPTSSSAAQNYQYRPHTQPSTDAYSNVPLTPPALLTRKSTRQNNKGLDLGSARGFLPTSIDDRNQPRTNKMGGSELAGAAGYYTPDPVKKTTKIVLSPPPKAKVAGRR